ncbi:MAG TPA: flavin monoamine oxidase family protein [Acidimicrobiia bacterium]|nr:flavin monoamine oxidase family protein [Acidimicrobiia bacterium]
MVERREVEVAVVGAGFAGLAAAHALCEAGIDTVVVEARDRVGGRVLNHRLADGRVVEVGGQWIGPTQDRMYALARELGVETYPTPTTGDSILLLDGREYRFAGGLPKLNPAVLLDYGQAMKRLDRMAAKVPLDAPWNAPDADRLDGQTLESWMRRNVRTGSARKLLALGVDAVFATEPGTLSLLWTLFYLHSGGNFDRLLSTRNGAQQDRFVGGSQLLAERMAARLPDGVLQLDAPVRRVDQNGDAVMLECGRLLVRARRAIVTVPPAVQARIDFTPSLPADRAQLLQRMPHGSVIKCMAVYDEPWWRAEGLDGQGVDTEGPVGVTFDNTPFDPSVEGDPPGVLLAFLEGDHARALSGVKPEERKRAVIGSLVKLFGPKAADPVDYVDLDWSAEEWTRGCYGAHTPPGVLTRYGPALRRPVGNVHWAGTETAEHWAGYMDGAVESGERAANEVLTALA